MSERCEAHWHENEVPRPVARYRLQFRRRIVNKARPLKLCLRCTAEARAWSPELIAFVESL